MTELNADQNAPVRESADIHIAAPVEVVWEILTDFENWPHWNKTVTKMRVSGPLAAGMVFCWKAGVNITSTLQEVSPRTRIVWTGRTLGIKAVHTWSFRPEAGGVRVQTEESFAGLPARIFALSMRRMLRNSLAQGLSHLKLASEAHLTKSTPL